jgi:hypothetical protein
MIRHFSHIFLVDAATFIWCNRNPGFFSAWFSLGMASSGRREHIPTPVGVDELARTTAPFEPDDLSFLPQKNTGPGWTGTAILGHPARQRQIIAAPHHGEGRRSGLDPRARALVSVHFVLVQVYGPDAWRFEGSVLVLTASVAPNLGFA